MNRDIDPIQFRDSLGETLARFTATAVPVSDRRFPRLAEAVRSALKPEFTTLVKGPFLESLPDFEKGRSIEELVEEETLHLDWLRLGDNGRNDLCLLYTSDAADD